MNISDLFTGLEKAFHALENTKPHQVADIEIRSVQNDYCYAEVHIRNGKVDYFSFTTCERKEQDDMARKRIAQMYSD